MGLRKIWGAALCGIAVISMGWAVAYATPWTITAPSYSMTYGPLNPVSGFGTARRVEQSVFEFAIGTGTGRFVDGQMNVLGTQPFPGFDMFYWSGTMSPPGPLVGWTVTPRVPPFYMYTPDHFTGVKDPDLNFYSWSGPHVVSANW